MWMLYCVSILCLSDPIPKPNRVKLSLVSLWQEEERSLAQQWTFRCENTWRAERMWPHIQALEFTLCNVCACSMHPRNKTEALMSSHHATWARFSAHLSLYSNYFEVTYNIMHKQNIKSDKLYCAEVVPGSWLFSWRPYSLFRRLRGMITLTCGGFMSILFFYLSHPFCSYGQTEQLRQ